MTVDVAGSGVLSRIDHLVLAVPDLEDGVKHVHELLGIRAEPGGRHPAWGTRNALLALGPRVYLEIVGPDPDRDTPDPPTLFGLDRIEGPRLVTWAARTRDLEGSLAEAAAAGLALGRVMEGSRQTPAGGLLTWRLTDPAVMPAGGLVPFLIDWGRTEHPAGTLPWAGRLTELRGLHPDPAEVRRSLQALDLLLPVEPAPSPGLVARISTQEGDVELR